MRTSSLGWVCLVLWSIWLFGLEGLLAGASAGQPMAPELGLALLLALAARMDRARARRAALLLAVVRSGMSADPAVAVAAAYLAAVELEALLRRNVDVEGVATRSVLAALAGAGLALWLPVVHEVRSGSRVAAADWGFVEVLPVALGTGLVAAVLGGLLPRLPGLGTLYPKRRGGREPWVDVAASL